MQTLKRIQILDGWRGLAVFLVLVGHFTFSRWVNEERMGVDLFFVLSGVLMAKVLFLDRMSLKDFCIRRFSRVFPTLFVFLIAATAISYLLAYEFSLVEIVSSLFFIRTYFPVSPEYYTTPTPTGHLWSLSVEEHSYVFMSVLSLIVVTRKRIAFLLIGIYAISVFLNLTNVISMSAMEFKYSLIRTESAIGFIAFSAGYSLLKRENNIVLPLHTSLICLLLAFVCYLDNVPLLFSAIFPPVLLGVAVNHITVSTRALQWVLGNPLLRQLGIYSYSIYLWQQVFYKLYYALPYGQVTGFVLSIIVGIASFYLLENRVRLYINENWSATPVYRNKSVLTIKSGTQNSNSV